MEKPKKSSLFKRVATALVLAPLTIALIYAGSPWINVLALVFGAMLSWESAANWRWPATLFWLRTTQGSASRNSVWAQFRHSAPHSV